MSPPERPDFDHPASIPYYMVDDLNAAYTTLRERGAEFTDEPHLIARMEDHDLWMVFLKDTEGNTNSNWTRFEPETCSTPETVPR